MPRHPDGPRPSADPPALPPQELEDLLFTLEVCRRALPEHAHPVHHVRLEHLANLVRWMLNPRP